MNQNDTDGNATDRCPKCNLRIDRVRAPGTQDVAWEWKIMMHPCGCIVDVRQLRDDTDRNDAEWVRESVIAEARKTEVAVSSGAWLARPVEGKDRIDVYRYDHSIDPGADRS